MNCFLHTAVNVEATFICQTLVLCRFEIYSSDRTIHQETRQPEWGMLYSTGNNTCS
jgi:hypothetical protein